MVLYNVDDKWDLQDFELTNECVLSTAAEVLGEHLACTIPWSSSSVDSGGRSLTLPMIQQIKQRALSTSRRGL